MDTVSLAQLSDHELLSTTKELAQHERTATARLIAALMEVDARRLYLGEGYSSLFTYCTQALRLAESAAYRRIEAARAACRYPVILERLADGSITLTTITLLAPHLTPENHEALLRDARHKTKRDVEHLVAALRPRPDVVASVRKLPTRAPQANATPATSTPVVTVAAPRQAPVIAPLAPQRYKVQVTVDGSTYDKLRRAQDLLRHAIPNGDPAQIFDRALTLLVEHLEKTKLAATTNPHASRPATASSRHIPAAIKREVWARDSGQCAFVGADGRCSEHGFLEFHHVVPFAAGGATTTDNLQLRCRAHNAYEAHLYFGPELPLLREEHVEWH